MTAMAGVMTAISHDPEDERVEQAFMPAVRVDEILGFSP
jgi:hypothetical protein